MTGMETIQGLQLGPGISYVGPPKDVKTRIAAIFWVYPAITVPQRMKVEGGPDGWMILGQHPSGNTFKFTDRLVRVGKSLASFAGTVAKDEQGALQALQKAMEVDITLCQADALERVQDELTHRKVDFERAKLDEQAYRDAKWRDWASRTKPASKKPKKKKQKAGASAESSDMQVDSPPSNQAEEPTA